MSGNTEMASTLDGDTPAACHWTIEQVEKWVESIGYPQYKHAFTTNYINGKKLVLLDASRLSQVDNL